MLKWIILVLVIVGLWFLLSDQIAPDGLQNRLFEDQQKLWETPDEASGKY